MTHASVVTLLEDVAKSLGDNVRFGYGALEDFNSLSNKIYPFVWLYPLKGSFQSNDSGPISVIEWDIQLNFLDLDSVKGAEIETAETWDKGHNLMEQFVHKLNQFILGDYDDTETITSNSVSISGLTFEAGRKATGDALSGWTLNFKMETPTEFDYCTIYED
jgi:hypothetical protein